MRKSLSSYIILGAAALFLLLISAVNIKRPFPSIDNIKCIKGKVVSVKSQGQYSAINLKKVQIQTLNGCCYIIKRSILLSEQSRNPDIYPGDWISCRMEPGRKQIIQNYVVIKRAPLEPIYKVRYHILGSIFFNMKNMNPLNGALYKALFWNNRESIPERVKVFFNQTGCVHFLALSGFHAALLITLLGSLLHLFIAKNKIVTFLLPLLFIYLVLTGFPSSLFRTVLIIFIVWLNGLFCYSRSYVKIIFISIIIQLLILKEMNLGFQFSYAAYSGLSVLSPFVIRVCKRCLPVRGAQSLGITLGAQSGVLPVLKYNMGGINPLTPLFSIILSPVMTLYMYGLVFLFILKLFSPYSLILNFFDNGLADFLTLIMSLFERVPFTSFLRIQSWTGCLIYLIILLIPVLIRLGELIGLFWKIRYKRNRLQLPESYCGAGLFPELDDTAAFRPEFPDK